MRRTAIAPDSRHLSVMSDLKAVLVKHGDSLSSFEMLALVSHLVGQLLALQDQTARSREAYIATISANIEEGNSGAIASVFNGTHPTEQ